MINPRTVFFMCFALFLAHAKLYTEVSTITNGIYGSTSTTPISYQTKMTKSQGSGTSSDQRPLCTPAPTKPIKGLCIFFLPEGKLELVLVALTVACFALLLTTLRCACQVSHLRGIISRLEPHCSNADLRAFRERRESLSKNKDHGQPTETCTMLSEVTTAQEERREDEETVLEDKTEEKGETEQPSAEPFVKGPNGNVTQENSTGFERKDEIAPESKDTVV
ncbi:uncharacterized protein LOC127434041 [Myxocyprinus asiaticus]|uniref:uncharacterized protein LOC127434041 n=1 Tax=Myxocyprinus asiaticus TaxID=70543 RepID=UPI002223B259|nr:uncharacterized protein LOC127434041 [Myxocyprinus asiaticus]